MIEITYHGYRVQLILVELWEFHIRKEITQQADLYQGLIACVPQEYKELIEAIQERIPTFNHYKFIKIFSYESN
jgi:hypothetical protein